MRGVRRTFEEQTDPSVTALVIVDMINDFCHPEGAAARNRDLRPIRSIIPALRRLLEAARERQIPVVHVVQTSLPGGMSLSGPWIAVRERAPYSAPYAGLDGSWGQQVIEELEPADGELVVKKFRYSAFRGTRLDHLLRARGVESVVCAGTSTNVCVMATASDAFELDYYPILVGDACASWNMELHEAALATFAARYGIVCSTEQLVRRWQGEGA